MRSTEADPQDGMFRALHDRNFRLYFLGQLCSISGNNAQTIALGWLVMELTGSGTTLGVVMAAQFLPMLVIAPVLGPFVDRFDKRRILMASQVGALSIALCL